MKLRKLTMILIFLLAFAGSVSAQEIPYPNELEGFEFFGKGKFKGLRLGVSNQDTVRQIFGKTCDFHSTDENETDCQYDTQWNIIFYYLGNFDVEFGKGIESPAKEEYKGKIWSVELFPRNTISFKTVKFPKTFKDYNNVIETWSGGSHTKPVRISWTKNRFYDDSYGLSYAVCIKDSDQECIKNNLNWISYVIPERLHRKYFDIQ